MNVLLVNPSQSALYGKIGSINQPHMGLACIGAVLEKEGCQVSLIDIDFDRISDESLTEIVCSRKIDLVGLTATTPVVKSAIQVANVVKKASSAVKVMIGGIHATIMPETLAAEPSIDFIICGEGEATVRDLVQSLQTGGDPAHVAGLFYRKGDQVVKTAPRLLIQDLDALPFPARHLFSSRQYSYPDTLYSPAFAIHTSRGCPGKCTFCQAQNFYGHKIRFRSAQSVADEVEILIKDFKAKEIHVWDDNFAAHKERVFLIRDEIKKRKLSPVFSFTAGIRVDTACDERVLKAMREMGGYAIAFGVESGNQTVLNNIGKGITLDQARKAVHLAKKVGFEVWGFFMLGFPDESEKEMAETIAFAKELDPHIAKFHVLKPYPGSRMYEDMLKFGLIDDFNHENYGIHTFPVHHTKYVGGAKINEMQKRAYKEFYLRPSTMIKQLGRIRSANRLLNNLKAGVGILRLINS
ncbi:MAG: radical SAM protein [Candidatus Omnitrophica bacterium]|nr:radical SAM protein [Candidatus Omnitrophota bacterium]